MKHQNSQNQAETEFNQEKLMQYEINRKTCKPWLIGVLISTISPGIIGLFFAIKQRSWMMILSPMVVVFTSNFFLLVSTSEPLFKYSYQIVAGIAVFLVARKQKFELAYGDIEGVPPSNLQSANQEDVKQKYSVLQKAGGILVFMLVFILSRAIVRPNIYSLAGAGGGVDGLQGRFMSGISILISGLILGGTVAFLAYYTNVPRKTHGMESKRVNNNSALIAGAPRSIQSFDGASHDIESAKYQKTDKSQDAMAGVPQDVFSETLADIEISLVRLQELRRKNIITSDEYDELRRKALGLDGENHEIT